MNEICNGEIAYSGDPYNVDVGGYYCLVCGLSGDVEPGFYGKQFLPHRKGVGGYRQEVVEAAKAWAKTGKAKRAADDSPTAGALLAAVDRLCEMEGEKG